MKRYRCCWHLHRGVDGKDCACGATFEVPCTAAHCPGGIPIKE